MVLGALMACLIPATAQNDRQEKWKTSMMQGSGSNYAPQVTAVGATSAASEATTSESYSPARALGGPRKIGEASGRNPGDVSTGSTQSPLGDAMLPLLLMSAAFAGVIYVRKRKNAQSGARV